METRSRTCRRLKWAGPIFCALMLAAWLASTQYYVSWIGKSRGFYCSYGRIVFLKPNRSFATPQRPGSVMLFPGVPILFSFGRRSPKPPPKPPNWLFISAPQWVKDSLFGWPSINPDRTVIIVPLWCPLLAGLCATAFFWWRNRPIPGHCRHCDYNLTGNVSGRCPECGSAIGRAGVLDAI